MKDDSHRDRRRGKSRRSGKGTPIGRIQRALTDLSRAVIDAGRGREGGLPDDLGFAVDLAGAPIEEWRRRAQAVYDTLHQRIEAGASTWADGTVWDFQSGDPDSPHMRPPSDRHTFAGYTATGKPTWVPFVDQIGRAHV